MGINICVSLLTIMALFLPMSGVQAQRHIGYVIDIEGRWTLEGNSGKELTKGSQVPAGGVIHITSPTKYDRIVIIGLSNKPIAGRYCRNSGECNRPLRLPRAIVSERSILGVILDSVMRVFGREPDRYSVHGIREEELPDGIVLIKDGKVELGPIFEKKGSNRYHLRVRPVPPLQGSQMTTWSEPIPFDWKVGKSDSTVSLPGVGPGLYELALVERSGSEYLPAGRSAWILVSRPGEHSKLVQSFQKGVELTEQWGKEVTPEATRSFLRAYLDYLSRSQLSNN
jgi:hypothetical protein